jgi:2-amino-4-hydroxy-6-hydroxymethyldihydropteridine diphosphokinase
MATVVTAFIGLGANLGDAQAALQQALQALDQLPRTRLQRSSRLWRSAPVDATGPDYLNAVAQVETGLDPFELLRHLQAVEHAAGRERPYRNAPRTLDLDLLLFGDARIDSAVLTVPHPRMRERAFVLLPLQELAPERVDAADLAAVRGQRASVVPGLTRDP